MNIGWASFRISCGCIILIGLLIVLGVFASIGLCEFCGCLVCIYFNISFCFVCEGDDEQKRNFEKFHAFISWR